VTTALRSRLREATGTAILEAAEQIAARDGTSRASLHAIAEHAGVAVGTIYNYFRHKQELFDVLFKRRSDELFEAMAEAETKHAGDPFSGQLHAFVRAIFDTFDAHRAFFSMALDGCPTAMPENDCQKAQMIRRLEEHARRILVLGIREGQLHHENDVDLLAAILVSIVRGTLHFRAQSSEPCAPHVTCTVSLFLEGAARTVIATG